MSQFHEILAPIQDTRQLDYHNLTNLMILNLLKNYLKIHGLMSTVMPKTEKPAKLYWYTLDIPLIYTWD